VPDPDLLERLKAWRLEVSREMERPAFTVMTNASLEAVAALRPATEAALLAVPGMGPKRVEAYGADLLRVVRGER